MRILGIFIVVMLFSTPAFSIMVPQEDMIACTMDAKMCPDGSYVSRQGPNCEFAPCSGEGGKEPKRKKPVEPVVKKEKLTMETAEKLALEYMPGTVLESWEDKVGDNLVYKVILKAKKDGYVRELTIDAMTHDIQGGDKIRR